MKKILVDSDAIPKALKEVLCKVAVRVKIEVIFVAANILHLPFSEYIKSVGAGNAFNGADDWIVENIGKGDLVITADIPLADRAIDKGAEVLNLKGDFFTTANIKNALAMREIMEDLRTIGEITGGPAPFSDKQRITFTNSLNKYLQKIK